MKTPGQLTLASMPYLTKKKVTKREKFLTEMDAVIPWEKLLKTIRRVSTENRDNGRPSLPYETMLRVYFLQQFFNLSDPGVEEALYDSASMRLFARVELGDDTIPDETTILRFRRMLEEHDLTRKLFQTVLKDIESQGLLVREGTIVDATIIHAPSSTKNSTGTRDPEMHQTRKGNQWYFGMKAHVGTDNKRGIIHSLTTTAANINDSLEFEKLLHGQERVIYGDRAYVHREREQEYRSKGVAWRVSRKARPGRLLSEYHRTLNREWSRVRAFGEHSFLVMKHLWGHRKVRYRGLYKNTVQLFSLAFLSNLYRLRFELHPRSL